MSACAHSPYWKGQFGTCMVCRAETAETRNAELELDAQESRGLSSSPEDQNALRLCGAEIKAASDFIEEAAQAFPVLCKFKTYLDYIDARAANPGPVPLTTRKPIPYRPL